MAKGSHPYKKVYGQVPSSHLYKGEKHPQKLWNGVDAPPPTLAENAHRLETIFVWMTFRVPQVVVSIWIVMRSAETGTCWRGTTRPSASLATGPAWLPGAKKVSRHNRRHHRHRRRHLRRHHLRRRFHHQHHHHHFSTVSELSGEKCTCQSCETKC